MHIGFDMLTLLLAVEIGIVVAVALLLWQLRRERAAVPPPAVAAPPPPPPPAPPLPPVAAPAPAVRPPVVPTRRPPARSEAAEDGDELEIEDARTVRATSLTLVWLRAGAPPERYGMIVDSVSRDGLVFGGVARRLDVIQIVAARRLFHTMLLPQERLLAAHDSDDTEIRDMRGWLVALPDQTGEYQSA